MKTSAMISISFLVAIAVACTKNAALAEPVSEISSSGVNKTVILKLVNDARKKGCQCGDTYYPSTTAVSWNEQLEKAAYSHSVDMNQYNYFSHINRSGNNAGERIREWGYSWKAYGENIAQGYLNEKEVVQGWLNSPGHCKNIMSGNFKEMGVARAGNYWTQELAAK